MARVLAHPEAILSVLRRMRLTSEKRLDVLPAYGVVIGTYDHAGTHQGQWLHEVLYVRANGPLYECAVDVNEPNGIFQYMMLGSLDRACFSRLSACRTGFARWPAYASSGAIDYIRSPLVRRSEGCLMAWFAFIGKSSVPRRPRSGTTSPATRQATRWSAWSRVNPRLRVRRTVRAPEPEPRHARCAHEPGRSGRIPVSRARRDLAGRLRDRGGQRRQADRVLRQVRHPVADHRLERIAGVGA